MFWSRATILSPLIADETQLNLIQNDLMLHSLPFTAHMLGYGVLFDSACLTNILFFSGYIVV
jgi:hypothetical protein